MKLRTTLYDRARVALLVLLSVFMLMPSPAFSQAKTGYHDTSGGFLGSAQFVTSAAYTATGGGTVFFDAGSYASGNITIQVTAVSGTSPTLVVNFKTCYAPPYTATTPILSACGTKTAWQTTSLNATGVYVIPVDHFGRFVTVDYTIGGTSPSFTFAVVGDFKPTS